MWHSWLEPLPDIVGKGFELCTNRRVYRRSVGRLGPLVLQTEAGCQPPSLATTVQGLRATFDGSVVRRLPAFALSLWLTG